MAGLAIFVLIGLSSSDFLLFSRVGILQLLGLVLEDVRWFR